MEKKEDYIERIQNNPLVKRAIETAKTKEEKQKIRAVAENMAKQIADFYVPVIEKIKEDPELAQKLREGIRKYAIGQRDVVNNKEE